MNASSEEPSDGTTTCAARSIGMLLSAALLPLDVAREVAQLDPAPYPWSEPERDIASYIATGLFLAAAAIFRRRPKLGRVLGSIAIVTTLVLAGPRLLSPAPALAALLVSSWAVAQLWEALLFVRRDNPVFATDLTQATSLSALALWLTWAVSDLSRAPETSLSVAWAIGWSVAFSWSWAISRFRSAWRRAAAIFVASLVSLVVVCGFWGQWWWILSGLVLTSGTSALVVHRDDELTHTGWYDLLLAHPERLFVGTFAGLSLLGAVLLALPQSASSGQSIGLADSIFTATSAVCVTGLAVLDTSADFSAFGQVILLTLIQVGGLGIMTLSTAALWALGKRMSLRHETAVASLISTSDRSLLFANATRILQLTLVTEALGALVLAGAFFAHGDQVGMALWRGFFTSISAFCNAGFALQSDSLVAYQTSPVVLHATSLLIIVGGLSPLAVFALPLVLRRSPAPISAQARIALSAAAILLALGFAFYLAFEWDDSLAGLSVADKIHNAWFQSATLRTAGFNSVDISIVRPATLTLMLVWMFIGGSPGGTAGGIKTTTVAVLFLSAVRAVRGQWVLETYGRRIPDQTRTKAGVIFLVAALASLVALVVIQLTQSMSTRDAVFEVVSALGTVGLTIGGTGALDGVGKAVIIVCMFMGRVGGLTFLLFLSSRRNDGPIGRPVEAIDVG